ncbi:MAG: LysE family transporter [Chloroflexales bacterium]|nr:LysE family transporter [Chloroflexales bacterium]
MAVILLSAFAIGLSYCLAPGILFTESLRRGATRGFRAAFLFQFGALGGDLIWAALALSGAAAIAQHAIARLLLSACGGTLLLTLAFQTARHAARPPNRTTKLPSARGDLLAGLTLSAANPLAMTFWLSIGGGVLVNGHPAVTHILVGASGFLLAVLGCSILIAGSGAWGGQFLTPHSMRCCNLIVAATLAVFGVAMLGHLLSHGLVV